MPPFIEISSLSKRFGDHWVIRGLSLAVEEGEIVVFQGPSGVGKSTFLRCLAGLEAFQEGRMRVGPVRLEEWT
jgi:ABC-type sugar transport system ATPase subunit